MVLFVPVISSESTSRATGGSERPSERRKDFFVLKFHLALLSYHLLSVYPKCKKSVPNCPNFTTLHSKCRLESSLAYSQQCYNIS